MRTPSLFPEPPDVEPTGPALDGYRDALRVPREAQPRPWRFLLLYDASGRVSGMEVRDARGAMVEHRQASGQTPEGFARWVANARHYVAAVNGESQ